MGWLKITKFDRQFCQPYRKRIAQITLTYFWHSRLQFSKNTCQKITARKLAKEKIFREILTWFRTYRESKRMFWQTIIRIQVKTWLQTCSLFVIQTLFYEFDLHKIYVFPVYKLWMRSIQKVYSFEKPKSAFLASHCSNSQ